MKEAKKALDNIQRVVLGGVAKCMRTTPLMSCETLLGFPPLDLWIRKVAFKVTSMKSQLALRANGLVAVLTVGDTGPCCTRSLLKKMVLRKTLRGNNENSKRRGLTLVHKAGSCLVYGCL